MKKLKRLPVLETERLRLREFTLDDAGAVFAYASDPDVSRHMPWEAHPSEEDSRTFLESVVESYEHMEVYSWGMELRETGRIVGAIGLHPVPEHDRAEVGYTLHREYWNTGLTTEALREVVKFGFERLGLVRIEARSYPVNRGSWRVMEKGGFVYEGTFRQREFVKGAHRDMRMYAILRPEYEDASG